MARSLLAGGSLAVLMGAGLFVPAMAARLEGGGLTAVGLGVVAAACCLVVGGLAAVVVGFRRRRASVMPSGVRAAVAANALIVAFCALELSDRLLRQDGRVVYWTTFLFPPALLIFYGLVAARPWAWWTARGAAALGVLWFLAFLAVIPFAPLQADGVPTPWYGRVYMAGVTLAFAGVMAGAFWSLGRPETRAYFGLLQTEAAVGAAAGD
ncbi:MAG: hypothetical protein U0746_17460 [Gemmataceae bacterium]